MLGLNRPNQRIHLCARTVSLDPNIPRLDTKKRTLTRRNIAPVTIWTARLAEVTVANAIVGEQERQAFPVMRRAGKISHNPKAPDKGARSRRREAILYCLSVPEAGEGITKLCPVEIRLPDYLRI